MRIFLHVDKDQSFLQVDNIVFTGNSQACPSTQNDQFLISLQYLKKEGRDEVDF